MPLYQIECDTEGREVYQIDARSKQEAQTILYSKGPKPVVSEVLAFDVVSIEEVEEEQ